MIKYTVSKDKRVRYAAAKTELNRTRLQFFLRTDLLSAFSKRRVLLSQPTQYVKSLKFTVRSHNRCVITGRSGSVYRYFKVSRIMIKQLASRGLMTGVRKSS